ncbi:hypothetical protein CGS54_10210 [Faecalibacterium prausnitzii]|uniref:mechanosensitive ion channel family protein n=1 Tax=Faecalibacterium prausnitzii TaxID=853 RepID=UPI000BEC1C7D|nr:mechanosensitive ion channel family protein [Faecalibacterium prausnitzii]PDX68803.1 hypothetical protein CGS54_10210 [Faecalibacterium prausnitzii]
MSGIVSRLSVLGKVWLGLAAGALALIVFGLAAPGSGLFFPLLSLWCNAALFALALLVLRRAGVELDLFHKAVLVGLWAAAVLYFYWTLGSRTFLYHWDYVNYILKQYHAEAAFAQSTGAGFRFLLDSITEDYTNFITLFTEFPFCLSGKTGDDYAFCQVFSVLPSLLVLLAGLTVKVGRMLRVKNRFWYFLIGFSWCATFPFVRMSAVLGQPDWFGLIFAFMLMLLTLDYRFDGIDLPRYLLIFAATAGIILTRRWYLYFVVGYCFAYVLLLAVSSIRLAKDGQPSRAVHRMVRLMVFGLCAAGAMVLLLLPMVRKILSFDYAGRYSYYNFGGITLELAAQTLRIGLLNFILIGMGLWFAAKRRLPALPCLAGTELLVSLLLFTRVQNTGSHQMLLFVPGWLLLFLVGSAALADGLKKHTAVKLCYWGFTMVFAVSVRCSPLTTVALPGFVVDHFPLKAVSEFVRLDKLTYDRTDAAQIQRVDDWIDAHCDAEKGEFAYMIPHDMLYNSDMFQYAALPDIQLQGKLAAGISIPGTHEFPVRFFEAKYVLTAEPLPQTFVSGGELSGRWNALFCAARDEHFMQAASFDMGNGTVFTVWERTEPADRAEVEYYLDAFAQEDALYPEMFSRVAEAWLAGHGL